MAMESIWRIHAVRPARFNPVVRALVYGRFAEAAVCLFYGEIRARPSAERL